MTTTGFIVRAFYNMNRLLFKKDGESEIIVNNRRIIENLQAEKEELAFKIKHVYAQNNKDR